MPAAEFVLERLGRCACVLIAWLHPCMPRCPRLCRRHQRRGSSELEEETCGGIALPAAELECALLGRCACVGTAWSMFRSGGIALPAAELRWMRLVRCGCGGPGAAWSLGRWGCCGCGGDAMGTSDPQILYECGGIAVRVAPPGPPMPPMSPCAPYEARVPARTASCSVSRSRGHGTPSPHPLSPPSPQISP